VVDDDADVRAVLGAMREKAGLTVTVADSGLAMRKKGRPSMPSYWITCPASRARNSRLQKSEP
jgi:CheY-like chemotaxis protein